MSVWAIIYNPTSGKFSPRRLEGVCRELAAAGITAKPMASEYAGHATEIARSVNGVERVVSLGGDGTLNEVANGLLGRGLPLVFLPAGTGNAMAYEMGIPRNPVRAARVMAHSKPVLAHPGMVGERAFMLMVSFGFDATAVYMTNKSLKNLLGPAAYIVNAVRALFETKPEIRVTTSDDREFRGVWVVGARCRRYGGPLFIHPRAQLFRADLGLVAITKGMIAPFAFSNVFFGTGFTGRGIRLEDAPKFSVAAEQPIHVQLDGEYLGQGEHFEVSISERALPFCVP